MNCKSVNIHGASAGDVLGAEMGVCQPGVRREAVSMKNVSTRAPHLREESERCLGVVWQAGGPLQRWPSPKKGPSVLAYYEVRAKFEGRSGNKSAFS